MLEVKLKNDTGEIWAWAQIGGPVFLNHSYVDMAGFSMDQAEVKRFCAILRSLSQVVEND